MIQFLFAPTSNEKDGYPNISMAQRRGDLTKEQRASVWEDPLEKEMPTHSSILAWEIPWTKDPGGLQSMGSQRSWTQLRD